VAEALGALLSRRHADLIVAARPLSEYTHAAAVGREGRRTGEHPDRGPGPSHATKRGLTHLTGTVQLVERAETAQMDYLDFVHPLLEVERGLREGRRFRNVLKLSGLPHHKTLAEFDFAFNPTWTPAGSATSPRRRY
jgi:hypothetical protein